MEEWLSLSRILWRPARWSVRGMFVLAALGPACTSVRASADSSMAPLWSDLLLVEPGGQASERHLVFSFTVGNVLRKCFFSTFALIFTLIQFDSKGPQRIACVIDRLCVGTFYKCGPLFWGGHIYRHRKDNQNKRAPCWLIYFSGMMSQLYSHFMKRWILFLLNRHNLVGMDIYDEFIESLTYEVISKMKVYNGIKMFIYLCLLGMLGALWVMCRCLCWTLICLCLRFPSPVPAKSTGSPGSLQRSRSDVDVTAAAGAAARQKGGASRMPTSSFASLGKPARPSLPQCSSITVGAPLLQA